MDLCPGCLLRWFWRGQPPGRIYQTDARKPEISIFQSFGGCYVAGVALVRILVDGYSLLHGWPELAPGRPRHSASAREKLVHRLTQYRDAIGTPITIFFDGSGAPAHVHTAPMPDVYRGLYRRDDPAAGAKYAAHVKAAIERAQQAGGEVAAFIAESLLSCGGQIVLPSPFAGLNDERDVSP